MDRIKPTKSLNGFAKLFFDWFHHVKRCCSKNIDQSNVAS